MKLLSSIQGVRRGERVSEYIAALLKLAEHCEYVAVLEDMLHDRIVVCGIRNKMTQQRLLQEVSSTCLTAYELAEPPK